MPGHQPSWMSTEQYYLDWMARMDLSPEELTDIYTARVALSRQLEGGGQWPPSAAQYRVVDWAVEHAVRPTMEAGITPHVAYHPSGYYEVRYTVSGMRGLFSWERAKGFVMERTGTEVAYPPF